MNNSAANSVREKNGWIFPEEGTGVGIPHPAHFLRAIFWYGKGPVPAVPWEIAMLLREGTPELPQEKLGPYEAAFLCSLRYSPSERAPDLPAAGGPEYETIRARVKEYEKEGTRLLDLLWPVFDLAETSDPFALAVRSRYGLDPAKYGHDRKPVNLTQEMYALWHFLIAREDFR